MPSTAAGFQISLHAHAHRRSHVEEREREKLKQRQKAESAQPGTVCQKPLCGEVITQFLNYINKYQLKELNY